MRILIIAIITSLLPIQLFSQLDLFEALGKQDKIVIPIEYNNGFITTEVVINETLKLNFIVDTGAEVTFLFNPLLLELMGLQADKKVKVMGADMLQEVDAWIFRNINIKLPKTSLFKTDLLALEEQMFSLDKYVGKQVDGILGASIFRGKVLKINYLNQTMTIMKSDRFEREASSYKTIPITIQASKPYVNIQTPSGTKKMLLDTGASITSLMYYEEESSLPKTITHGQLGVGIGGKIEGFIGSIDNVKLGSFDIKSLIVNYQSKDSILLETLNYSQRDGLLGNRFLSQFTVAVDFQKSLLYLKKNRTFRSKVRYNMSGLIINAYGPKLNQFYVESVLNNSPSEKAGIQKGDIIKQVNGLNYRFRSLNGLYKMLSRKQHDIITLQLERAGQKLTKRFVLKRYLE